MEQENLESLKRLRLCLTPEPTEPFPLEEESTTGTRPLDAAPPLDDETHEDEPVQAETPAPGQTPDEQEAERAAEPEAPTQPVSASPSDKALAASGEKLIELSRQKVATETERLTRRSMKLCVAEHIQRKCQRDADFAGHVLQPKKTMVNCFRHVTRMARDYARQEMKENDESPMDGGYGTDVPDGLCYQWAEAYFLDPDAQEDKENSFVPRRHKDADKKQDKESGKKSPPKAETQEPGSQQLSLL